MKKKLATLILVCTMLFAYGAINAAAATEGVYTYSVSGEEAKITKCSTSVSGELVIPNTLGGYPVTSIGSSAFYGCSRLVSITIPGSVTSIDSWAFDSCSSLTSIIIPDGVTRIGNGAFWGCSRLASITIPDSVTYIGIGAFAYCSNLVGINVDSSNDHFYSESGVLFNKNKTALIRYPAKKTEKQYCIPGSVISIGNYAFCDCIELTSIVIPDGVTSIDYSAFENCIKLTSLVIPDGVTSIGYSTFEGCSNLTSITIPDGVTSIGDRAFYNCSSLTSITIPDGVTRMGYSAFQGCSNLTSITIPDGVTSISSSAFYKCSSLTSITIPDGVTSIGRSAFSNCSSLTSVTIPSSVTSIGEEYAFYNCSSLKDVYYKGSEEEWNEIPISPGNEPLTNATIHFMPCTRTALSNNGKTFTVTPVNIEKGKTVILALYSGKDFVEMQKAVYAGEAIPFTTTKAYTKAKVFVWEDLESLNPVCEVENVK